MGATCCGDERKILKVDKRRLLEGRDESYQFKMNDEKPVKKKIVKKKVAAPPKVEPVTEDVLNIVRNKIGQFIVRKPGELSQAKNLHDVKFQIDKCN